MSNSFLEEIVESTKIKLHNTRDPKEIHNLTLELASLYEKLGKRRSAFRVYTERLTATATHQAVLGLCRVSGMVKLITYLSDKSFISTFYIRGAGYEEEWSSDTSLSLHVVLNACFEAGKKCYRVSMDNEHSTIAMA